MPGNSVRVVLLRSRKQKRVVYLECGKEFADLLLSILIMPVGGLFKALEEGALTTGINKGLYNMYASLNDIENSAFCVKKDVILTPSNSFEPHAFLRYTESHTNECLNCKSGTSHANQLCDGCEVTSTSTCVNTSCYLNVKNAVLFQGPSCPACRQPSLTQTILTAKESPAELGEEEADEKGFVTDNLTFMVKEDLSIMKSDTLTSFALLRLENINSLEDLDTKEVYVGRPEGLLLVRAAVVSKTPLTDVFGHLF